MSIQYIEAPPDGEFEPTYQGRYLKQKFASNPNLKRRVPKRWLTEEQATIKKSEEVKR